MGCILPTMHRRSQHCCELLHPFAHHCQHARNNVCTQPSSSIRGIPCWLPVKETNGVIFYYYNYYYFVISARSVKTLNKTSDGESKSGYFSFFWSLLKGREKTKQKTTTTTTTTTNKHSLKIVTSYGRVSFLVFVFSCCSFVSVLL